jgi:hypothetical protein
MTIHTKIDTISVTLRVKLPFTQVMTYTATIDCSITLGIKNQQGKHEKLGKSLVS